MYARKQLPSATCESPLQKKPGLCGRPATHAVLLWNEHNDSPTLWDCSLMCSMHLTWLRKDPDRAIRAYPMAAIDYAYTPPRLQVIVYGTEPE